MTPDLYTERVERVFYVLIETRQGLHTCDFHYQLLVAPLFHHKYLFVYRLRLLLVMIHLLEGFLIQNPILTPDDSWIPRNKLS